MDTKRAKAKIDKDAIIKELNDLVIELKGRMQDKDEKIRELNKEIIGYSQTIPDITDAPSERRQSVHMFSQFDRLQRQLTAAQHEDELWTCNEDHVISVDNLSEEQIRALFDEFDDDGKGTIDSNELQNALKSMDVHLSMEQIDDLINEIDENKDGVVDFDEFKVMIGKSWFTDFWENQMAIELKRALTCVVEEDDGHSTSEDGDEFGDEFGDDDRKERVSPRDDEFADDAPSQFDDDRFQSLRDELAAKDEEIANLRRKMMEEALDEKEQDSLDHIRGERDSARKRLSEMKQTVDGLRNDIERSQTHIGVLNSENGSLKRHLAEMKQENTALQGTAVAEHERVEQEKTTLQSELSKMRQSLENTESDLEIMRENYRDLRDDMDTLQHEMELVMRSKLKMVGEFSEQMNLLREVIATHCGKEESPDRWLPFSVNIEWKQ